ncbi:MAG TPA: pyrrolo-quinoline quinone, partial [Verrucomicrobiae bacterium]
MRRCARTGYWVIAAVLCAGGSRAADWPQWLGADRSAVWRESGIIESFPKEGPPVLWRTPIGAGYAGPIVVKGRVYVLDRAAGKSEAKSTDRPEDATAKKVERVTCLSESDGKVLWRYEYECDYRISYPAGPRVAPLWHEDKL